MLVSVFSYLRLLNSYRTLVGSENILSLLFRISKGKAGFQADLKAQREMQRWKIYCNLGRDASVRVLQAGDREFKVSYSNPESALKCIEMKLRVPMCDSSDSLVFEQIFLRKEYYSVLEWFSRFDPINNIHNILDIGANIGCAALFFHTELPNAQIYCLEPEAGNFERLKGNLELNKGARIRAHMAALWTSPCRLSCVRDFRDGKEWGSRFIEAPKGGGLPSDAIEAIDVFQLAELANFDRIEFLKMDVEGAEAVLLKDSRFLEFLKERVSRIAMEVHEEFLKIAEAVEILKRLGFETCVISEFVCAVRTRPSHE